MYRAIRSCRRLVGKSDIVRVRRRGIAWQLDLAEAIDLVIYLQGQFEPASARAYRQLLRPADTVLDIGANVGAHTLPLAQAIGPGGKLIAFEPTRYAYEKLLANIELNPQLAQRITAEQIALGRKAESEYHAELYASWDLAQAGDRHPKHRGLRKATTGASMYRLDSFLAERGIEKVDFIKIDVDGYECDVLCGAEQTLGRWQPTLLVELAPYVLEDRGSSLDEYLRILTSHGYRLLSESGLRPLPMQRDELVAVIGDDAVINAVARPS